MTRLTRGGSCRPASVPRDVGATAGRRSDSPSSDAERDAADAGGRRAEEMAPGDALNSSSIGSMIRASYMHVVRCSLSFVNRGVEVEDCLAGDGQARRGRRRSSLDRAATRRASRNLRRRLAATRRRTALAAHCRSRSAVRAPSASGWRPVSRRKASAICSLSVGVLVRHGGRQRAGGFDELHVVQQHQRLQRRVGAAAGDGADFARWWRRTPACWAAAPFASTRNTASGDTDPCRSTAGRRATSCSSRATDRRPAGTAKRAGRPCGDRASRTPRAPGRESARPTGGGSGRGPAAGSPDRARAAPARSASPADTWPTARSCGTAA